MNSNLSNQQKIIIHKELINKPTNSNSYIQTVTNPMEQLKESPSICILQLNQHHPSLQNAKFATIQHKYRLIAQ